MCDFLVWESGFGFHLQCHFALRVQARGYKQAPFERTDNINTSVSDSNEKHLITNLKQSFPVLSFSLYEDMIMSTSVAVANNSVIWSISYLSESSTCKKAFSGGEKNYLPFTSLAGLR